MTEEKQRTITQNKAMHLYFTQVAVELRNQGQTMKDIVRLYDKIEIEPTTANVKEMIWKPIQVALLKKQSTKKLTSEEVTRVYDNVSRFLTKLEIDLPFPSEDEMIRQEMES